MKLEYKKLVTPCYLIDKEELEGGFVKLKDALEKRWNNYVIGYSYKTNSLPWIVNFFDKKQCYSEVVSEDEYHLGKKLGVRKNKFIYNGPIKTFDTFIEAVNNGCYVNIDSNREVEWACNLKGNYKLGLRVNFDIEEYCLNESQCGDEGGRFGFCYENGDLKKVIDKLTSKNIQISGIHLHVSSKTRSLEIYRAIAKVAVKIIDEYNLKLDYIDVGGGFFGGMPDKPQFQDYIDVIATELEKVTNYKQTKLIVEPGMCLIGSPISYVTTVIDTKTTTHNRFIVTDGSRTNIDPFMKKDKYFYKVIYTDSNREIVSKQVICGCTCMENDRLFTELNSKKLLVNDIIIYKKTGAYTMCLTPLFINYFPNVYVKDKNNIYMVRKKWTAKEYVQNSIIGDETDEYFDN